MSSKTELSTRANGKATKGMVTEFNSGQTVPGTKASGLITKLMEKVPFIM